MEGKRRTRVKVAGGGAAKKPQANAVPVVAVERRQLLRSFDEEGEAKKRKRITDDRSAAELSRDLLRCAERGETEKVKELLQREEVFVRFAETSDYLGRPKTAL